MKRKLFSLLMGFILMALLIPVGNVQAKGVTTSKKGGYIVVSTKIYSFTLPKAWSQYPTLIKSDGANTTFYSKTNYKSLKNGDGWVFAIGRCTISEWKKEGDWSFVGDGGVKLGVKGKYVYYTTRPQDVNYNYEDKQCREEYVELSKNLEKVKKTFKFL